MKVLLMIGAIAGMFAPTASASFDYNTTGSTLSCGSLAGCVQNGITSITEGGITIVYNIGATSGVDAPSIINLGDLVATGTGTNVDLTGLLLTIVVNSTPGGTGILPTGVISGVISTGTSGASILFSPNNTTSLFGTLPGRVITGGGEQFTYQILNPSMGIAAPTAGSPMGQALITGDVTETTAPTPEPATFGIVGVNLALAGVWRRRLAR